MIGAIIIWSGAVVDIPVGWQLCDGTNGTPNLNSKVVFGAGLSATVGSTGGSVDHEHTFESELHSHGSGGDVSVAGTGTSEAWDESEDSGQETVEGTTDATPHLPPFHVLAYIQRLV